MEEPDLLVAGASAAWEARWALVTGGPWSGSGPARTAAAGTPIPGTCGQDLAHEGGPPAGSRPGRRYRLAGRAG